jgi:hypothetical protein
MKPFAKLAVAGISGVVLSKLFASLFFPLFGLMLGLLGMTVKLALVAAVVFFVYAMERKRTTEGED